VKLIYEMRRAFFHARILPRLLTRLENGMEVWRDFRAGRQPARLVLRGGPTIHLREQDEGFALFWEIYVDNCYLRPGFYRPAPGDTILDLGANIGVFSIQCQHAATGVRIHAVEPNPATFGQLRLNVSANRLDAAISTYNLAVSDAEGTLYLEEAGFAGHQALNAAGRGVPVPCVTLDQLFATAGIDRVDLLKIDTEGAEVAIVAGASRGLWYRVRRVVIEYHENVNPGCGRDLLRQLTDLGYTCESIPIPRYPNLGIIYATSPAVT
jgi:FkbM family methyltransferase